MNRSNVAQKRILLLVALAFVGFVVYINSLSRSVRKDVARMQTVDKQVWHSPKGEASVQRTETQRRLVRAIYQDDAPQIAAFLQQGVTGNTIVAKQSVCDLAASNGAVRVMSMLLAQGTDANARDQEGNTLLMKAVVRPAMVDFLLAHGADVNATNKYGETASCYAAGGTQLTVMQSLIKGGADINAHDRNGNTLLMIAVKKTVPTMVDFLMAHGADVNAANQDGVTALCYAAEIPQTSTGSYESSLTMAQSLIKRGARVNIHPQNGSSPMAASAIYFNVGMLRLLLAHGGDPNEQVNPGHGLLYYARKGEDYSGKSEYIQTLIQAGAKE